MFTKEEMLKKIRNYRSQYSRDQREIVFDKIMELNKKLVSIECLDNDRFWVKKVIKAQDVYSDLKELNSKKLFGLIKNSKRIGKRFGITDIRQCLFPHIRQINREYFENMLDELVNDGKIERVARKACDYYTYAIIDTN